jgi:hypothetical protein
LLVLAITGCVAGSDTGTNFGDNAQTNDQSSDDSESSPGDPQPTFGDAPSGTDPSVEGSPPPEHPGVIGSLQERAIECAATGAGACDLLVGEAAATVYADAYRRLAATCGGRVAERSGCEELWGGQVADGLGEPPPNGLGAFDEFATRCSEGELDKCDELTVDVQGRPTWDHYLPYGATCAGRRVETDDATCVEVFGNTADDQVTPSSSSMPYSGNVIDPQLQLYADSCLTGTMGDCDELARAVRALQHALVDLTAFASACGGRNSESTGQTCQEIYGSTRPPAPAVVDDIGRTAELDELAQACARGEQTLAACDSLRLRSPAGSGYMEFADSCGTRRPPDSSECPLELLPPVTTTVPNTTVPETTIPETTIPETTVPETTFPDTTLPASADTHAVIEEALGGVGLGQIDIGSMVATSAKGRSSTEVRVPFTDISADALRRLEVTPTVEAPYEFVRVLGLRIVGQTLVFDVLVDAHDANPGPVSFSRLDITYEGDTYSVKDSSGDSWPWQLLLLIVGAVVTVVVEEFVRRRWFR